MMSGIVREGDKKERRVPLCGKVHSAENTRCRKSLLKLKQQEYLLEKNLANSMENMKLEPEVLRLVLHNMSDIARTRQIVLDNIKRSLKEIIEEVRSVQSVTVCPENIQNLDTNVYKHRLVKLSQKIGDFKESCHLQTLSQEQTALESELHEFQSNLHKYENATGSVVGKSTSTVSSSMGNKRRHDYKKIQDLHALITKTGHTDNWSNEDHLLFLKMRRKCSNVPALVSAIQAKCPDLTAEMIVNHEAWYKVYLDLREKQRLTVRQWRKQKEMEKIKKIREEETTIDIAEQALPQENTNSDITEKVFHVIDKTENGIKKADDTIDNRANRKKELIRRWRMEKENKRWLDEEQARILAETKLAAQEQRKKERVKKIQEILAEYREKKSMENSFKISKNQNISRPKYDPMLITAFRKQDQEYVNKRKNLIERRKPIKIRTTKVAKSQATKKRDYSTLLNLTEVWIERCKMQKDKKEPRKLQYIKDIPRLNVQWRNQESTEIKDALTFF